MLGKIYRKLWGKIVYKFRDKSYYPLLYKSYYVSFLHSKIEKNSSLGPYFSAQPNPGAGIGHQMANWIAGYWWAKQFSLPFAHIPFSNSRWEELLGFGNNEIHLDALLRKGYKKVRLPLFSEDKPDELDRIKRIIKSYTGKKVVFVCEQDQFYRDQYGVMYELKQKFYSSVSRKKDVLLFDSTRKNVAIHVRRGDIVQKANEKVNENLAIRWQDNTYFVNTLRQVVESLEREKQAYSIFLFSQGNQQEFSEFEQFSNITYCLDMNPYDSFLHMVHADILITSKSSFSYKPALLNKGIKVVPSGFWHGYPVASDWIIVNELGKLNQRIL